ncbi:hypothetical protein HOP50_18g82590 [Chloropicon primus]|nr:hypothetical protein HOP50_18g82590 [Chloropicon primus]
MGREVEHGGPQGARGVSSDGSSLEGGEGGLCADLWLNIFHKLHANDHLPFSLTCKMFRDVQLRSRTRVLRTHLGSTLSWSDASIKEWSRVTEGYLRWLLFNVIRNKRYAQMVLKIAAVAGKLGVFQSLQAEQLSLLDRSMFSCAARGNQRAVLEWLIEAEVDDLDAKVCAQAAQGGHLELLKWLRNSKGCPWSSNVCLFAAEAGNFEILEYAHSEGCRVSSSTVTAALRGGHLDVYSWLVAKGCKVDRFTACEAARRGYLRELQRMKDDPKLLKSWSNEYVAMGAAEGSEEAWQWLIENGCPFGVSSYQAVMRKGNLDVFKRMVDHSTERDLSFFQPERYLPFAALFGHLPLLQHAVDVAGMTMDDKVCAGAAKGGHLGILQWARSKGCPWSLSVARNAAEECHLDVLQWARSQDPPCPWDEKTCEGAARGGHLDVLKWLRSQDPPCPWNGDVPAEAAQEGHIDVLKWALANGCPVDERTCAYAARAGHLSLLLWCRKGCLKESWNLDAAPCPWNHHAFLYATASGHEDVCEWLENNGAETG